ncbi:hypothetical protein RRG08_029971 [Elysia crispata]|uniref:Uncharacterized protein n=1 Tax=Elysia crispata TaxID=231223 RepID=A0AAE0ZJY9_9GAST|nr:hypothetical protein RRG08_029971 [Elysia crispata]
MDARICGPVFSLPRRETTRVPSAECNPSAWRPLWWSNRGLAGTRGGKHRQKSGHDFNNERVEIGDGMMV